MKRFFALRQRRPRVVVTVPGHGARRPVIVRATVGRRPAIQLTIKI